MKRVAVLVSGGGTNLQALLQAAAQGQMPHARLSLVVSSNPNAHALHRAQAANLPTKVVNRTAFQSGEAFNKALLQTLQQHAIEVVVLAGFLCILGQPVVGAYPNKILNVHPSLIPAFCGDGFYGLRVHRAALARGVKLTGATVHLVNHITDGGRILLQKSVPVLADDTPETLQKRVMEQAEWLLLPQAVELVCSGGLYHGDA